ncbi:MAG: hypothetical protein AMXMBFR13_07680 [Phycisphaerae bacterium]
MTRWNHHVNVARSALLATWVSVTAVAAWGAEPLGTGFNYQGVLTQNGVPVSDVCDFQFSLWDEGLAGNQIGAAQMLIGVAVVDGVFAVELNSAGEFGPDAFKNEARWLAVAVASPSGAALQPLSPRQKLTAVPLARFALNGGSLWSVAGSDIHYDTGKVGVGTASPFASLTVNNNEAAGIALAASYGGPAGNAGSFSCGNAANEETALSVLHAGTGKGLLSYQYGTGLAGRFQIDNPANNSPALHAVVTNGTGPAAFFEGRVGIGTPTPSTALEVAGTVTATSFTGDGSGLTGLSTSPWNVSGTDVSYVVGNVGVGVTDPLVPLHIRTSDLGVGPALLGTNTGLLLESTDAQLRLYSDGGGATGSAIILGEVDGGVLDDTWSIRRRTVSGGSHLEINHSNGNVMWLQPDGDVGIGTSSPAASLHVASDASPNVQITQADNTDFARLMLDGNGSMYQLNVGSPGSSLPDTFNIYRAGTGNILSITPAGNVGIGTAFPQERLQVTGGSDVNGASGGFVVLGATTGQNIGIDNNEMQARDNGTPSSMTINGEGGRIILGGPAGGDVGVKTTNPQADFHVAGDARFDGTVTLATTTRYLSLSAVAFTAQYNATVQFTGGGPAVISGGNALNPSVVANAHVALPHGAIITEVRAYIDDESVGQDAVVSLWRVPHNGTTSGTKLAEVNSSGSSGLKSYDASLAHTVDNVANSYLLNADWDDPALTQISLRSVRITYTVNRPVP